MENDSLEIHPNAILGLILVIGLVSWPLMLVLTVFVLLRNSEQIPTKKCRYLIYVLIAVGLGYINTTKPVYGSDLAYYYWLYDWAGSKSVAGYIALIPKEPLYYIYNYLMRLITFGNFKLFMIVTTLMMYFPVMISFDKIYRENEMPVALAIITSVILACFSQYFFYTAQIIRQVLAGSIAFYFIVRMTFNGDKWSYIGLACAGLIHASAYIFCIYFVLYFTHNWKVSFRIFIIILTVILFAFVLKIVSSVTDGESTLAYAAHRANIGAGDEVSVGLFPKLICFSVIPMSILSMWKLNWNSMISNILLMGVFIVLYTLSNSSNPLFVLRFMEYAYIFIPLCCVLMCYLLNWEKITYIIMGLLFLRFILSLNHGGFIYESVWKICLEGYPLMIINILTPCTLS